MRRLMAFVVLSLFALPAMAAGPWYARGDFNGWTTDNLMTQDPQNSIHWSTTVTGLFTNFTSGYKLALADWSQASPGSDGKVTSNNDDGLGGNPITGGITFHMWDQQSWNDGWSPNNTRRVGYDDPHQYGWEIVGSFNNWPNASFDPNYALTDMGNGLYSGQFHFNAGIYDYKFRGLQDAAHPWNVSMGSDFGNSSGNNQFTVASNGDLLQFDLDLPNGRFRSFTVDQHGDFNGDGNTDAGDYVWWRKNTPGNAAKYTEWRSNFGRTTNLSWIAHSADGTFGTGGNVTLQSQGGGLYTANVTGLVPGQGYDIQVLRSDNSSHWPGTPAKITADAAGNINLNFYELSGGSWGDGYQPDTWNRLGYTDSDQFGWEIVGDFNAWPDANDPLYALTEVGNTGVYTGSFQFPTAGTYLWKFRHLDATNPWSTSIGDDFGNAAGNNSFTVAADGDTWNFELDLPHGKWRAYHPAASGLNAGAVPEPASIGLLMFGLAIMGLARRR